MADEDRIRTITANLETTYQNMRLAAANVSGLLSVGRATCDEVKAYNLWALATYNAQRGMLSTLRAAGDQGVPELPEAPTLFSWQGMDGSQALDFDCSGDISSENVDSLQGAMKKALRGPSSKAVYLSLEQVNIVTTDQHMYDPENSPSFKTLSDVAAKQQAGLGIAPVLLIIVIAGIAIGVALGIKALMAYLTENSIQEETTERTRVQSDAFQRYTAARLSCYSSCTAQGKSTEECVSTCAKLVEKPDIKIDSARGIAEWGALQWVGLVAVVSFGSLIAYKLYRRRHEGQYFPTILP